MECRGQEVLYVEKQVLVSYIPSIEISENASHNGGTYGGCNSPMEQNQERGDSLSHWKHV